MDENEILKQVRSSSFLKLEVGNNEVEILSSSGFLKSHYIGGKNVICKGEGCFFCSKKSQIKKEIYYRAKVNDQEGYLRLPLSIFIQIMDLINSGSFGIEKPRDAKWLVIRKGQGKETRYTVNFLGKVEPNEEVIKKNSEKVENFIKKMKEKYNQNYEEKFKELNPDLEVDPGENTEIVNPEDIPF
jgi:hypothetical protein